MRKLALASIIPAALVAAALFAGTASANTVGICSTEPAVCGSNTPANIQDYSGHTEAKHCDNLTHAAYYNPVGTGQTLANTGSSTGNSEYHAGDVNADPTAGDGGSCTGATVATATGWPPTPAAVAGVPVVGSRVCGNSARNPCDGSGAFYVSAQNVSVGEQGLGPTH